MKSSRRRCGLVPAATLLALWLSTAASDASEPVGGTCRTRWLANRLRLVTVEGRSAGWVSVRLLVRGGTLDAPSEELHLPHVVEHLAFGGIHQDVASNWLRRDGGWTHAWTQDHRVVHEFDVPADDSARLLRELRLQWDAPGFSSEEFTKEIRRVQHELSSLADPLMTRLATECAPQSALARSEISSAKDLEAISAKQAWEHFRETYVGARMTLVVVASAIQLQELEEVLQAYASIPTGRAAEAPSLGDLSWLRGPMRSDSRMATFGVWFAQPIPPLRALERCILGEAASQYVREQVAMRASFAYDVDYSSYEASDATIWMFTPTVNTYVNSVEQAQKEGRRALCALAEDSTWWNNFRKPGQAGFGADDAVDLASLIPHNQALPEGLTSHYPSAREMQTDYRRIVQSAAQFQVVRKQSVARAESQDREGDGPIHVAACWFLLEIFQKPTWRSPLLLGWVLALAVLITLILRRATLRLKNATALRR